MVGHAYAIRERPIADPSGMGEESNGERDARSQYLAPP